MKTEPCEVCVTTTDGCDIEQRDCGKVARIEVNGFPMCAACFAEYEAEGLIESVALIADQPAATETGPEVCAGCGYVGAGHVLPSGRCPAEQAPQGALSEARASVRLDTETHCLPESETPSAPAAKAGDGWIRNLELWLGQPDTEVIIRRGLNGEITVYHVPVGAERDDAKLIGWCKWSLLDMLQALPAPPSPAASQETNGG